ncbi:ABC transporter permease [Candidatus Woesearchaeota archaeon]|nr:ABC transporter permease [Candidatus Woesearchaeota archaeon]
MLEDYFFLAFRNLRKKGGRSWLTMIGIFIGIAAVVSLISLSEGMRGAILTQFTDLGTDKLIIQAEGVTLGPPGSGVSEKLDEDDLNAIKRVGGIKGVAGRLTRVAKTEYKDEVTYNYAASIPQDESRKIVIETDNLEDIEKGRFLKKEETYKVVLGYNFGYGDIFKKKVRVGDGIEIEGIEFEVVGILEKQGSFTTDGSMMINERPMKDALEIGDELDLIAVQVISEKDTDKVAGDIEKTLRKTRDVKEGKEDFTIETPEDTISSLNSILSIVQVVIVGIAAISLLVGGIGIMNTMYTSVLERTKEIGVMKATGAKNNMIFSLFLIESGMLGMAGGGIGIMLGFIFAKIVEVAGSAFLGADILRAHFPLWLIIGALGFSFIVGTLAGTLPAVQASKLKPVDALRFRK